MEEMIMERVVYAQVAARIQPCDISENEYREFERKLEKIISMKKAGRPKAAPKVPTPEQEKWLKENYKLYTRPILIEKLGVSEKTFRAFWDYLKLRKKKGPIRKEKPPPVKKEPAPPKEIIRYVEPPKFVRPRADHTNMTQEQRIDYWINYPI